MTTQIIYNAIQMTVLSKSKENDAGADVGSYIGAIFLSVLIHSVIYLLPVLIYRYAIRGDRPLESMKKTVGVSIAFFLCGFVVLMLIFKLFNAEETHVACLLEGAGYSFIFWMLQKKPKSASQTLPPETQPHHGNSAVPTVQTVRTKPVPQPAAADEGVAPTPQPIPATPAKIPSQGKEMAADVPQIGTDNLTKRLFLFLEEGAFDRADDFCERILNQDPENPQAYLGKLMITLRVNLVEDLPNCPQPFDENINYKRVLRFGDEALGTALQGYVEHIKQRNEADRLESTYQKACQMLNGATQVPLHQREGHYNNAASLLQSISGYKDADTLAEECKEKAKVAYRENAYATAKRLIHENTVDSLAEAMTWLQIIPDYKDAADLIEHCQQALVETKDLAEKKLREMEKREKRADRVMLFFGVIFPLLFIIIVCLIVAFSK